MGNNLYSLLASGQQQPQPQGPNLDPQKAQQFQNSFNSQQGLSPLWQILQSVVSKGPK